jgi:hypothetical protein
VFSFVVGEGKSNSLCFFNSVCEPQQLTKLCLVYMTVGFPTF